jgi:hypothetical protein
MNSTPRTDAIVDRRQEWQGMREQQLTDFARELEREARRLRDALEQLWTAAADFRRVPSHVGFGLKLEEKREAAHRVLMEDRRRPVRQASAGGADVNQFPHMCQDGHEPIGFSNGPAEEVESCPVCLLLERLRTVQKHGEVYVYPKEWRCAKMGGPPSIEDYERIDLSDA